MSPREDSDAERSWLEYRRLVLEGLERIDRRISETNAKIDQENALIHSKIDRELTVQREDISRLKVDVGTLRVWSTLSGTIAAAVVAAFMQFVFKK